MTEAEILPLPLGAALAFNGQIRNGYTYHPDQYHLISAVGSNIVITDQGLNPEFLIGHEGRIVCFSVSKDGRYIASGEETKTGFPAYIIIWDFEGRKQIHKLKQHNGKVQDVCFSPSGLYLVSLGGLDDKAVVVWNVTEGRALAGHPVAIEAASYVVYFNRSDESFITGGLCQPRIYDIDFKNTKLLERLLQLGHFRRVSTTAVIDDEDKIAYVGTTTGDIMAVHCETYLMKHYGPSKDSNRLQGGVTALALFDMKRPGNKWTKALVAGSGNGDMFIYGINDPFDTKQPLFNIIGKISLQGKITSLNITPLEVVPDLATPNTQNRARGLIGPGESKRFISPDVALTVTRSRPVNAQGARETVRIGPPRTINVAGRVVPTATAQRSLIPRKTEPTRPPQAIMQKDLPLYEIAVSTEQSQVYTVIAPTMESKLVITNHQERVTSVAFPRQTDEIFASAGVGEIRLWNISRRLPSPATSLTAQIFEVLRIDVKGLECLCLAFNPAGTEVISGWDDGKIRSFGPQSGRLLWMINDAHKQVTAVTTTNHWSSNGEDKYVVSGGIEGQVRVWKIGRSNESTTLVATMKEHRSRVTGLKVNRDDEEVVSSGDDGTIYSWSLKQYKRIKQMLKHTAFKAVDYLPDCTQIVGCGTDRQVTYYDIIDGTMLRELTVSDKEVMGVAVDPSGTLFAAVGKDRLVKVYDYDEGKVVCVGEGHADDITSVAWSNDGKRLITGAADGGVYLWNLE